MIAMPLIVERTYPVRIRRTSDEEAAATRDLQRLLAALTSTDGEVRAAGVRALGQMEDPALVDRIALHIGDADESVRTGPPRPSCSLS
jgi:hypothetical protein